MPRLPLLLLLLLLLLLPQCLHAWRNPWHRCSDTKPKCKSDRFDVVFDGRDPQGCKVYKCQCREPKAAVCTSGKAKLKTDSHSCQYYDCVVCPTRQPCPGSKVSKYKGDDDNACPLYSCECDPHPARPACGADEQLKQGTDTSGCAYYFCQQTRSPCPRKPSCSANQELLVSGTVEHCRVYKCECLTPARPMCELGSQPRLQDDGLGCQSYRCVENRTPCPQPPICTSQYQVVSSSGVDSNNCVRYECRCMPLAELECPDGYQRELLTDSATSCQYNKCTPACMERPNCTSVYQHAAVIATLSNGCPSYACRCKQPEIINCVASDAHLVLTKAPDGSNCDIYSCRSDSARSCSAPTCQVPRPTLTTDSLGCTVYTCSNCPIPPTCLNIAEQLLSAGKDSAGCTRYICYSPTCPKPEECAEGQLAAVQRYAGTCPVFACVANNVCSPAPTCATGHLPLPIGFLSNDCPEYICQPSGCSVPSACSIGQQPNQLIDASACVTVQCAGNARSANTGSELGSNNHDTNNDSSNKTPTDSSSSNCPKKPDCASDSEAVASSRDAANCILYTCQRRASTDCTSDTAIAQFKRQSCSANEEVVVTGHDAAGCPLLKCRRSCSQPPSCRLDETLKVLGIVDGCAEFECVPLPPTCPPKPQCSQTQEITPDGRDSKGCDLFICCSKAPTCMAGFALTVTGKDAKGCSLYDCLSETRSGSADTRSSECELPAQCSAGTSLTITGQLPNNCKIYACCPQPTQCSSGLLIFAGVDANGCSLFQCQGARAASSTAAPTAATTTAAPEPRKASQCPDRAQCQYKQFSVRYEEWHSGEKCDMFSCLNLGTYNGKPLKCHDNPDFCEISQTVETFIDDRNNCQRILCSSGMPDFGF